MKLIISQPDRYYSPFDEESFFHWLEGTKRVIGIKRRKRDIEITIDGTLDSEGLYDPIALIFRYNLGMECLRELCLTVDREFFDSPGAYWYDEVFKDR
jgi:hypothetical protein